MPDDALHRRLAALRHIEAPPGSVARLRRRLLADLHQAPPAPRRTPRFVWGLGFGALAVAAASGLYWRSVVGSKVRDGAGEVKVARSQSGKSALRVGRRPGGRKGDPAGARSDPLEIDGRHLREGALRRAPDRRALQITTAAARYRLTPGSELIWSARRVALRQGRLHVEGQAEVGHGRARARIEGRAQVQVAQADHSLHIWVTAGDVRVLHPPVVVEHAAARPARPDARTSDDRPRADNARPGRTPTTASRARRGRSVTQATDAMLTAALRLYRQGLQARRRGPAASWPLWRRFLRQFPHTPLRHEVHLNAIADLTQLGRHNEAQIMARRFLQIYPASPRRAEIERYLRP